MKKLLVLGSCVSRDALEYAPAGALEPVGYFARSSLAALTSAPFVDGAALARIPSPFQRRMVRFDMQKTLWKVLETTRFDVLLLDLIDERFAVVDLPGKGRHTLSAEYAAVRVPLAGEREYIADSDAKMALWCAGWARLSSVLANSGQLHKLRVNRVYWGREDVAGVALEKPQAPFIARMNRHLDRMYDEIAKTVPPAQFIKYKTEDFRPDPAHKWGLAPFHYAPALYRHTISALLAGPRGA